MNIEKEGPKAVVIDRLTGKPIAYGDDSDSVIIADVSPEEETKNMEVSEDLTENSEGTSRRG